MTPIDLTPADRPLPADLASCLRTLFGSVPGVSQPVFQADTQLDVNGIPCARITLLAQAWSPSFHRCTLEIDVDMPNGFNEAVFAKLLAKSQSALARQSARAAAALRHGLDQPLALVADGFGRRLDFEMRHLVVDSALPHLTTGPLTGRMGFVDKMRQHLSSLHDTRRHLGGSRFGDEAYVIEEGDIRIAGLAVSGNRLSMTHRCLRIRDVDLPETVLVHASGRRLGDLIEISQVLDGRIVEEARIHKGMQPDGMPGSTLVVDLAPDWVPLEEATA